MNMPLQPVIANYEEATPGQIRNRTTLADAIRMGRDGEACMLPGWRVGISLKHLKLMLVEMFDVAPEKFCTLPGFEQNKITRRIERYLLKRLADMNAQNGGLMNAESEIDRVQLHHWLRGWAEGPLRLERPSGSSYHHLVEYDRANKLPGNLTMHQLAQVHGTPELLVVEHDWAAALAGSGVETGEVRMPFPHACWEFRITGVRVLGMVHVDEHDPTYYYVFCVYGKDHAWVADDYIYGCTFNGLTEGVPHHPNNDNREFRRVFDVVYANIRASCVLLDARVGRCEVERAPPKLVQRRIAEKKTPPNDYQVVRLLRDERVVHRARSAGGAPVSMTRQGGHWRRGTWVHFDDPDSGEVQYANSGGFFVSKTWRRWHLAGDLNRMIRKEYRL